MSSLKQEYKPQDIRNNKLHISDRSFHDWYRFVLSYPPHLVNKYFDKFELNENDVILDPFCGTGTTLVEAKKHYINSIGIEAAPMSYFASKVKTNWMFNIDEIQSNANLIYEDSKNHYQDNPDKIYKFNDEQNKLILKNSICDIPLHKCLILLNEINNIKYNDIRELFLLALAYTAVYSASNLKFGPEVGVRKKQKADANVFEDWFFKVSVMSSDLNSVKKIKNANSEVFLKDSRDVADFIPNHSISAVITSPPYPNEKDYTRTTRLESVLLGFIKNKKDLRAYKQGLMRSNTRNVYVSDEDDLLIETNSEIDKIAKEIERRRIALNKTSGFERLYHRVTRLYFGGMKKHLESLKKSLTYGAKLAYVVGDQASYLQVKIRTGELLARIASELGYKVIDLDLFRTRLSTSTGEQLREEVLVLEWKGNYLKRRPKIMNKKKNRYDQLIEKVFFTHYKNGDSEIAFDRDEFVKFANELDIELPKNLGDIIYSYRYRNKLPAKITDILDAGEEWILRSVGRGKYKFAKSAISKIYPNNKLSKIKILDSTPEIIKRYALNDEQALLAIIRYNRLIDIFLGISCYSLQNHLRTAIPDIGQVETDEIYVGVSKKGTQYIIPIQAKGRTDTLGIVQIEQDFAICKSKFPILKCRPIAAQFINDDLIALFEFEKDGEEISISEEKHYLIVPNTELSDKEINNYNAN